MRTVFTAFFAASLAGTASADLLGFVNQITPVYRGAVGAEYSAFDVLTQPALLPNFPDVGGCASASLVQLDPAAILTSTGNIYSFATDTSFELTSSHSADVSEVSVQIRTAGTVPDTASFLLTTFDAFGNPLTSFTPDQLVQLDALGNEYRALWNVTLAGSGVRNFRVDFASSGSSMSTDVVVLDVYTNAAALVSEAEDIRTSSGANIELELAAGSDQGGNFYLLLGSLSGTAPGVPVGGVLLPLVPDAYTNFSLSSAGSALFQNTIGFLDACGRANATLAYPSGLPSGLVGLAAHHAYFVVDTIGLSYGVVFASNPVSNSFAL